MPRKIRELIQDLKNCGFYEISGGGKGSHRKFTHKNYAGAVTLSGKNSEDAKLSRKTSGTSFRTGEAMKKSDLYHKWVEWSEQDQVYIGKCPDLITGIHGDNPVELYSELCKIIDDVVYHFEAEGRLLPNPRIRPMQEVA